MLAYPLRFDEAKLKRWCRMSYVRCIAYDYLLLIIMKLLNGVAPDAARTRRPDLEWERFRLPVENRSGR